MRAHRVRALLMGGQACVSYGAAEFSRDVDLAILASLDNAQIGERLSISEKTVCNHLASGTASRRSPAITAFGGERVGRFVIIECHATPNHTHVG
jgi:hypothetical protein